MLLLDNYKIETSIYDILLRLKSQITNGKLSSIEQKHDEIVVSCPHHKDGLEKHPSCSIYVGSETKELSYGVCHCFTCGFSGPFYHFVAEVLNVSDIVAKNWLIKNFGKKTINTNINLPPPIQLSKQDNIKKYLSSDVLNKFINFHPYMIKRKLSKDICEKFQVKYDKDTNCLVFPVWDAFGNLSYLTRRSVDTKQFYIDEGANKKDIYLLNFVIKENYKTAIVVESQINALTLWQYGYPSIALFGAGTTKEQMDTLNKSPIRHYILAYDNDFAGNHGIENFLKYIRKDVLVDIVTLPVGKDVNDLAKIDIDNLFNKVYDKNN